jgi:hypothetical protein
MAIAMLFQVTYPNLKDIRLKRCQIAQGNISIIDKLEPKPVQIAENKVF